MTKRQSIVAVVGVIMIAVGLFADAMGIGEGGIGYKQVSLIIAGTVVLLAGYFLGSSSS